MEDGSLKNTDGVFEIDALGPNGAKEFLKIGKVRIFIESSIFAFFFKRKRQLVLICYCGFQTFRSFKEEIGNIFIRCYK